MLNDRLVDLQSVSNDSCLISAAPKGIVGDHMVIAVGDAIYRL